MRHLFAACLVAAAPAATALGQVASGVYLGNGSTDISVTVGFQPDVVIIHGDNNNDAYIRTSTMTGDSSKSLASADALRTDRIKSLDANGFTVGTDADVNENNIRFYWTAFEASAGVLTVGSYTGLNSTAPDDDDRSITGIGFQPDLVIVMAAHDEKVFHRTSAMSGDFSMTFKDAPQTDRIQALEADGFQVGGGDEVNDDGETIHYAAWRAIAGSMAVGTYTGNNTDGRSITGVGFRPQYVATKNDGGNDAAAKSIASGISNDESHRFDNSNEANDIQALEADGFQLGTRNKVNANSQDYYWFAFAAAATAVELVSFEAIGVDEAVELEWETGSEVDNLGFHLYRSFSEDGPWQRITDTLIPGLGSSPVGARYGYRDAGLTNGVSYHYQLEDVESTGATERHGPVSATPAPAGTSDPPPGGDDGDDESESDGDGESESDGDGESESDGDGESESDGDGESESDGDGESESDGDGESESDGDGESESGGDGESEDPADPGEAWIRYGDPEATSLQIVERGDEHVLVELVTGGFYALPDEDGGVWLQVPGFVEPDTPGAPALPVSRTWLEAVAGRQVKLVSVEGREVVAFDAMRPAVSGELVLWQEADGTQRAGRSSKRAGKAFRSAGLYPEQAARLLGVAFQGDVKKAQLELSPLRWDRSGRRLLLAQRLRVRVTFTGKEPSELPLDGGGGRAERGGKRRVASGVIARLAVRDPGLHAVRYEDLFGERGRDVRTPELRLSRQGEAVAFHIEPEPRMFRRGSLLYFVSAGAAANPYGQEAVYELSFEDGGVAMTATSAEPYGPAVSRYWQRHEHEVDQTYQPSLLTSPDPWLWDAIPSGTTRSYTLSLSDLASSTAGSVLEVWLQGGSDYTADPDHHVRVSVNGHPVAEASWDGKLPFKLEAELSSGVLSEGENQLQLENVGDTQASYSLVLLDRYALTHPRQLVALAGELAGSVDQSGTAEVQALGSQAFVVDTTSPAQRWLTGTVTTGSGVRFRAEAGHSYLTVAAGSVRTPELRRAGPDKLRHESNRADYLVLAPREFLPAAQPLLVHRTGQGLETLGVAIEDVYDQFGHGETRPEAVRAFLGHAYHNWRRAPRYVLLLGDATYDFEDNQGTGVVNRVPPYMIEDPYMWTVSDPAYASVNGEDLLPDLAIGRLPAQSLEQAQRLVQKTLAWEQAGFGLSGPAVLVADNSDYAGDFEGAAERVAGSLLAGREVERIYLSQLGGATRATIREAFDRGASLMSYLGHGAIAMWASENVFIVGDVPTLAPQAQQPVLLTMNCLNGYFHFPFMGSLAEQLVDADGKGAIAAFAPSSMSNHAPASVYHEALIAELASGAHARLGDAILAAQAGYTDAGHQPELLAIYQLLGDPALAIR